MVFLRRSIKGGTVGSLNRYFESNQFEEPINIFKKQLKINDNETSNKIDKSIKVFNIKRDEFKLQFESDEKVYRKVNTKELDKFPDKKLGELKYSKELQKLNKDNFLVSYDFSSLNPSAQIDLNSIWPKIETVYPFQKTMSDAVCSFFNSRRWNYLNKCPFLTVNYHNPENLIFQNLPVKEKF